MVDLSESIGFEESLDFSSKDIINDQSQLTHNGSIDNISDSFINDFGLSNEAMRILFIAIATITILVCLTICITVCICICLNRRRNLKRQEKSDHLLIPEQSEKISNNTLFSTKPVIKDVNSTILSSSIQQPSSNITAGKIQTKSHYYDNLDDIPFIDESRPTSYIDMTRV